MIKVLVIEDEQLLRESILYILKNNGINASGAEDGRRGLLLARELMPDVILCDVRMPELNGYEVLQSLRQDPVTATIPFILITAETMQNVMRQGQILGADGYLMKPFTTLQLLELINQVIRDS